MPGLLRRPAVRVAAGVLLAVLSVTVLLTAWVGHVVLEKLDDIPRVPAFEGLEDEDRPTQPESARSSATLLLVGSDARSATPTTGDGTVTWEPGAQRTDTIMLVHVPADRSAVHLVSVPRDAWVPVPGHGEAKVNAAYSWGGPPLLVRTVEALTDVRVDHVAVVDFAGFRSLTDAVGGVDVRVPETVRDPRRDRTWSAGTHHLDGAEALDFVRQRHGLPRGDLDRIERQQQFLAALTGKLLSADVLTRPTAFDDLLDAVTDALTVDDRLTTDRMRSLATSLRNVRRDDLTYSTAPVASLGQVGGQSVVFLDEERTRALWDAMRHDRMARWLRTTGS